MTHEAELRSASDTFLSRLERLRDLEEETRCLTPGTPRMRSMTEEIAELARDVVGIAEVQDQLAQRAGDIPGLRPIDDVPPRHAHTVLEEWRAAERRVASVERGTAEEAATRADIDRLRGEYRRVFDLNAQPGG